MTQLPERRPTGGALRVAGIYTVLGLGWIVIGDLIVSGPVWRRELFIDLAKGSLFVLLSAALIWWLTHRELLRRQSVIRGLELLIQSATRGRVIAEAIRSHAPVGTAIVDEAGRVVQWSTRLEQQLGWREDEVLGKSLPWLDAAEADLFAKRRQQALATGTSVRYSVVRRTRDGQSLPLDVELVPIQDPALGESPLLLLVQRARSAEEDEATQSERFADRLSLLDQSIREGLFIWDAERRWFWGSRRLASFGAIEPQTGDVPFSPHWLAAFEPGDAETLRLAVGQLESGESVRFEQRFEISTPDTGRRLQLVVRIGREAGEAAAPVRLAGSVTDLTWRVVHARLITFAGHVADLVSAEVPYEELARQGLLELMTAVGGSCAVLWERAGADEVHLVAEVSPDGQRPIPVTIRSWSVAAPPAPWMGEVAAGVATSVARFASGADAPDEIATRWGLRSAIAIPFAEGGRSTGFLAVYGSGEELLHSSLVPALQDAVRVLGAALTTTRIRSGLRLRESALASASLGVVIRDAEQEPIWANASWCGMLGLGTGRDWRRGALAADIPPSLVPNASELRARAIQDGLPWRGEVEQARADGRIFPAMETISPIRDESGSITHWVGMLADLSNEKEAEAHISHLARYDAVTNLPNRSTFLERATESILRAERTGTRVAFLFLDLDHFKRINDTLGHSTGDAMLRAVGALIERTLRTTDFVARFGGDEFAVLLSDVKDGVEVGVLTQRLLQTFESPLDVGGVILHAKLSAGIALFPDDGTSAEALLGNADLAMYRAKADGRGTYRFYADGMHEASVRRGEIERGLHVAVARGELAVVFQPQIELATDRVMGAEALVRWRSPQLGAVSPAEFIPVAEETGLIRAIGEFVLKVSSRQVSQWRDTGDPAMRIAVNLSLGQFRSADLPDELRALVLAEGATPDALELELTESMLADDAERATATVAALHELGFEIAVDDFGTGYSSMFALRAFRLTRLKIDQSFTRDLTTDPGAAAIVRATIALAHSLGLKALAEGVETAEQLQRLRELGCDEGQGYFWAKPLPPDEFERWLAARST